MRLDPGFHPPARRKPFMTAPLSALPPRMPLAPAMLDAVAASGNMPPAGDYRGDRDSFIAFARKYAKSDWPVPDTVDYCDPEGKGQRAIRYAHWTPPPGSRTGVVVHFNGRTEFIERNIYTYRDLLQRGFEVWSFDWRGQGFSQRRLPDKQKHDIDSFDTYVRDAGYLIGHVARVREAGGSKVLLAHSMGGQIALRYLLETGNAQVFDHAVFSSPLLRIPGDWYARPISRLLRAIGLGSAGAITRPAQWKGDFLPGEAAAMLAGGTAGHAFRDARETTQYSHDLGKVADINCLVEASIDANGADQPDLRVAAPTNDWLHAALESTDRVMQQADRLRTPLLIVRAKPDTAVDNAGQDAFAERVRTQLRRDNRPQAFRMEDIGKGVGLEAGHELLLEVEPVRRRFFELFDAFVQPARR